MELDESEHDAESLPQGGTDAYADAASADIDPAELGFGEGTADADAATTEPEAAGDESTSEPVEAADDEGEGTTPAPEFDANDPATWPDEIRAEHAKYKGSAYELAKAQLENRRTFKTELDRRLGEVLKEREGSTSAPAAPTTEQAPPPPSPQVQALTRETNVLADRYDADLANHQKAVAATREAMGQVGRLDALIEHYSAEAERLKGSGDDLALADVTEKLAGFKADKREKSMDARYFDTERIRLEASMAQLQGAYEGKKAKLGDETRRQRTVEEERRTQGDREATAVKTEERNIVTALNHAVETLKVPPQNARRFKQKMLKSLNGELADPRDLTAYFLREGKAELGDWSQERARGVAGYAKDKRADVARPAPAAPAKGGNSERPMTRQEATRRAIQASKNIPLL